jgi:hypothetical protein
MAGPLEQRARTEAYNVLTTSIKFFSTGESPDTAFKIE